jgi:predicted butyrate kinase (DUF1464 family)
VCAAALAIAREAERQACRADEVSCILLELGGAFTAALAIEDGRIVDGLGGSSGAMGARAAGAFDGEVAYLAGTVGKGMLFRGGRDDIGGQLGWDAYVESVLKAIVTLTVPAPRARSVVLSGRHAGDGRLVDTLRARVAAMRGDLQVRVLAGFASDAGHAAQGAALIADGLAGGTSARLVDTLGIRHASGTALDHLYVISPASARARLGLE